MFALGYFNVALFEIEAIKYHRCACVWYTCATYSYNIPDIMAVNL